MVQSEAYAISGEIAGTEKKSRSDLSVMLRSMLKIGFIGFGGGSALIPVIEQEVVDGQHILSREEYSEAVVSACLTPGALPVEIAAGVGRKKGGILGMLLGALAMAAPGALLTLMILMAAVHFEGAALNGIRVISVGLGGFITSLLASYGIKTARDAKAGGRNFYAASLFIAAGVFLLTGGKSLMQLLAVPGADGMLRLSTFQVLILSFGIMILGYAGARLRAFGKSRKNRAGKKAEERNVSVGRKEVIPILKETFMWALFAAAFSIPALFLISDGAAYILRGFLSSLLSFGGGDAYLSVADGLFVHTQMVSSDTFYGLLVPVANALPGSILCKILTGTGYLIGAQSGVLPGIAGAAAGFAVSTAASGMVFGIVYWIFRTFKNVSFFQMVGRWIRPIISGLLAGVIVTLLKTAFSTSVSLGRSGSVAVILTLGIAAMNLVFSHRKTNRTILLVGSAAAGVLLLFFA